MASSQLTSRDLNSETITSSFQKAIHPQLCTGYFARILVLHKLKHYFAQNNVVPLSTEHKIHNYLINCKNIS